jgi:hypothetical protein
MPEFHFYGSTLDRKTILEGLFGLGFRAIPNRNFPDETLVEFRSVSEELVQATAVNKLLYVSGPFTTRPPALTKIESGAYKGTYVIEATLKNGGPLLALSLPSCVTEGGRIRLGPGSLFHPREFWDDGITQPVPPSEELREAYRRVKKVIMENTRARRVMVAIRIGQDALRLFDEGAADILVNGKWLSRTDGLQTATARR